VLGAADAIAKNAVIIDRKASDLNRAMLVLYSTVVLILIWHGGEVIYHERHAQTPGTAAATARPTARPQRRKRSRSTLKRAARLQTTEMTTEQVAGRRKLGRFRLFLLV